MRPRNQPHIDNEVVQQRLQDLLSPAVYSQADYYRQLGLRARILTLPVMMAAVLALVWRQVPSVHELTRVLAREDLLWCRAVKVSQQALSQRFLEFPSELFERVLHELLSLMQTRWQARRARPLPKSVTVALTSFERIWIADGSTLEALFRKLKSLEPAKTGQLGGKMMVVMDLVTRLPVRLWLETNPYAHDTTFGDRLKSQVHARTLMILDRGFWDFHLFDDLMRQSAAFITRVKAKAALDVLQPLSNSPWHRDSVVRLGTGYQGNPVLTLRLIEVRAGRQWHTYLTSVLDPDVLPPGVVADLYQRRWRIEDSFNLVKRLLGLRYLWTGSANGIRLQVWATWIIYVVLVDLADDVADTLRLPFNRISLEMVFRGLYHFSVAHTKGLATDPVTYFAAPENQDLGIVKAPRKRRPRLDFQPFPKGLTSAAFP